MALHFVVEVDYLIAEKDTFIAFKSASGYTRRLAILLFVRYWTMYGIAHKLIYVCCLPRSVLCFQSSEAAEFADRIAATAIVNQAALKCMLLGVPVNADNVIRLVGDFIDPSRSEFMGLINEIILAIDALTIIGHRNLQG